MAPTRPTAARAAKPLPRPMMSSLTRVKKGSAKKPVKTSKKSPNKSATEAKFACFSYLPPEIQSKIFTEALGKPHVHFMKAKSFEDKNDLTSWSVRFNRKQGPDPSGFTISNNISHVSHNAARAVRLAAIEKARMPFTQRTHAIGNIDISTDIVCVEFGEGKNNWRHYNWARGTQFMFPQKFDRNTPAGNNLGIRRVAIIFNQGTTRASKTNPELSAVFRCFSGDHGGFSVCKICPAEVMGFLDIFPDLEGFYIIFRPRSDTTSKNQVQKYKERYFATSQQQRQAEGLEEFHDNKHSYLEINSTMAPGISLHRRLAPHHCPMMLHEIGRVVALAQDLRTMFVVPESDLAGVPRRFTMSLEKRKKVKITALVETERT